MKEEEKEKLKQPKLETTDSDGCGVVCLGVALIVFALAIYEFLYKIAPSVAKWIENQ